MQIRQANHEDFNKIWPIFHEIVSVGETYAYPMDTTMEQAEKIWMQAPCRTYVAEESGEIFGTYYIKTNQPGQGSHVCNCGYMVASRFRGRGIASLMCVHSQKIALDLGYKAMQFNFVASTNKGAVRLWQKLGFEITGCLPKAFNHPVKGFVDAFVMYKWLI